MIERENPAYVTNFDGYTVSVIDGKTNAVIGNIKVGKGPSAVSVNPSTNVAYVANYHDNTISVIGGKTNTVIGNIKVGKGPYL
jgi:YVTN family beta-propeller protein